VGKNLEASLDELAPRLIAIRRDLHRHPELGYREVRTAEVILAELKALGLNVRSGVVETGIVGSVEGALPGPTVLLRADMDGLPIQEQNSQLDFASEVPNVMHACGHDAHTAILLGTVRILTGMRDKIRGTVRFLFQPAEEEARQRPGESRPVSAATQVIEAGVLERVSAVLGFHMWPDLQTGQVGLRRGAAMAGGSWFRISVKGRSVHAAYPHQGIDSITSVANLINLLQLVVTRHIDPGAPVLLNVGTIQGGYRRNVVADVVEMTGTVRALNQDILDNVFPRRIEQVVRGLCAALGAEYALEYYPEVPVLRNSPALLDAVHARLSEALGPAATPIVDAVTMTGEDFAFYTERVPGLFLYLGCTSPTAAERLPLHSPRFNFDEHAIGIGAQAAVIAALALLEHVEARR
jgi:amidohydrolase